MTDRDRDRCIFNNTYPVATCWYWYVGKLMHVQLLYNVHRRYSHSWLDFQIIIFVMLSENLKKILLDFMKALDFIKCLRHEMSHLSSDMVIFLFVINTDLKAWMWAPVNFKYAISNGNFKRTATSTNKKHLVWVMMDIVQDPMK